MSTRRRTSTIGFTRHGAEALAPTGRQAKADEAGLLGAIGDEVVQIAAVVAPGVLLPLPIVVDALELADEEAQVVVAQLVGSRTPTRGGGE